MAPETFITYHRDEEALTIIGHLMDSHNKHSHTLNDISFKLQELEETVTTTVTTNLSGGTGIEITNDNVINLDFSEFSTDNITEGSTNFFHSDERVDDRISNLLQEGSNIVHSYDDIANTFTISTSMDPIFDTVDSPIVFTAVADVNIIRGQVVYISGTAGNGSTPTVNLAIASDSSKMPAFGMARDNVNSGNTVKIVTFGSLYGITLPSTITFSLGDTLYVSSVSAGAYTNVQPAGESNLIQNIGKVQRIGSNSSSVIKVGGAGRTNATSNLNSGNIFYGNSSDQAVTAKLTEGNNVTITHDSVNETLTISALGTAVSGNENEVHVINSTGDGFKVSSPLLYTDSGTNSLNVGHSANGSQGDVLCKNVNCVALTATQNVNCLNVYSGDNGQSGYRTRIGNNIHLGADLFESTWNGSGSISAIYYDVYNGTRKTKPEIKIARRTATGGQSGHHTFQIGPHSTTNDVKFIVDLYNNENNPRGEIARVAIGKEPLADTPFTVGSLHVLELSSTAHQVIIGGSTTQDRYFTFSETGKLGLGNTQDYGSSGQVLTSGGTGAPTWESVNSLLVDESQHVSGSITHSDTVVDIYNTWESNTQYKGAILTLSDNSYDSVTQTFTKTVRAAIKGGTSSTGTDTSGYLAIHTSEGTNNEAREVARFTPDGEFGIGTDSPATKLHTNIVGSETGEKDIARFSSVRASDSNLRFLDIGAHHADNFVSFDVTGSSSGDYIFRRGGTQSASLNSKGFAIGDEVADNTYQGLTIKGDNPSVRIKTTSTGGWTWNEYVNNSGTNTFSAGTNHSVPYYGIKAGSGLDNPHLAVASSGYVGIGTIDPSAKLDVRGGIGAGTHTHAVFTGTTNRGLAIRSGQTGAQHNGKAILDAQDTDVGGASMDFQLGGVTKMAITNNGDITMNNLQINTSASQTTFQHNTSDGADNLSLFLASGGSGSDTRGAYIWARGNETASNAGLIQINAGKGSDGRAIIYTNGSERIVVEKLGNVGIGTVSPSKTLEVNGDLLTKSVASLYSGAVFVGAGSGTTADIYTHPSGYSGHYIIHASTPTDSSIHFDVRRFIINQQPGTTSTTQVMTDIYRSTNSVSITYSGRVIRVVNNTSSAINAYVNITTLYLVAY